MEGNDEPASHVIAQLVQMGFEISLVIEAIEAVGPSLEAAIDFLVDDANRKDTSSSGAADDSTNNASILGKRAASSHPPRKMKQSSILDHMNLCISKRLKTGAASVASISGSQMVMPLEKMKESFVARECDPRIQMKLSEDSGFSSQDQETGLGFEQNISCLLQKHFGFSTLKSFQKEALKAWLGNQDCLVLAATGSGKSLCFQIPALLTGKVVVVISPLISLMRDQCLKLAKHGISACFLGSGQTDSSVEHKAMNGMYNIIYVCPETVLRLIEPLQKVAENYGIALFAIDEVHCVSKWGHDFRSDYRRLSVLRENFSACKLKFLRSDIPLMALTATATVRVREDIIDSLCMSKYTKIVITSFFRPNLRFSVKHSITSSPSSYEKDFDELIDSYTKNRVIHEKELCPIPHGSDDVYDSYSSSESSDEDDFDVVSDEFCGSPIESSTENEDICGPSKTAILPVKLEERMTPQGPPEQGPTIIYVPTRKETLALAKYLSQCGIRAAPYNAKLPAAHLRRVHSEFHQNMLEVVVATIAFGMGIDKSNVRKIIHYGWPQSLEAYYQEAGRAGRDGKLADCILFANLSRIPTLLPSRRSEEQTKVAYKMLSDCFRYGMDTTSCRAKTLVEYFGEDFADRKCLMCDVCVGGPPEIQNLKEEADIFMQVVASLRHFSEGGFCDDAIYGAKQMPNFRMIVSKIREQFPKFAANDRLWWQGLARILEDKGYLREGNNMTQVCIKFPELTELGVRFLQSEVEEALYVHPQADMLLSMKKQKSFSTFSDWGKGWADPKIRQQRLQGRKHRRKKRPRRRKQDLKTVRGRLAAKLSKPKR